MVALTSRAKQANICSILATKFNPGNFSQSTSFQLFEWSSFQRGSRIISDCSSSWPRDSVKTFIRLSSVRTATRPAVHSLWKCLKSSNFKGLYSGLCSNSLGKYGSPKGEFMTLRPRQLWFIEEFSRSLEIFVKYIVSVKVLTWTGGDKSIAPRRLDKTVQSIILDKPAKQAIWTASSSPSISLRSSSGSAPNSTILPSRCTA